MSWSTTLIRGFDTDDSIAFFSWPGPRSEPFMRKLKPAAMAPALASRKTSGKCGRGRKSFHSRTQTSTQELTLA
jgi:hypothetical protein